MFSFSRSLLSIKRYYNKSYLNKSLLRSISTAEHLEEDIFDSLNPQKAPPLDDKSLVLKGPKYQKEARETDHHRRADVVISCKNPRLNHRRNQIYDKLLPIPLASKGWTSYKSKGDYFTVKIKDEDESSDSLFWDDSKTDFSSFNLNPKLIEVLNENGIHRPTKIQSLGIPSILSGRNTLLTGETGCGKTLAYLIPVIEQVLRWKQHLPLERDYNAPLALILAPSRDLVKQIGDVAIKMSHLLPFSCNVLVGGRTKKKMLNPQLSQVDVQVSTLGALSKLTTVGVYKTSDIRHVVLDEGDTLLDDSFNEVLVRYLNKIKIRSLPDMREKLPTFSQLSIVSATIPTSMNEILSDIVDVSSLERVCTDRVHSVLPHVPQTFYRLGASEKPTKLLKLVNQSVSKGEVVLIFSNKSATSDWVSLMLNENGIATEHLNATMPEIMRREKFTEFLEGNCKVLSCTDIASRGLNTVRVNHVINYEFPGYMADYIHRCGRTGRVGSPEKCHISNFVTTDRDVKLVQKIETAVRSMDKLPNVNANINKIIKYHILNSSDRPKKL